MLTTKIPTLYVIMPELSTMITWIKVISSKNANETKKEKKYL